MTQTLSQRRARHAWQAVQKASAALNESEWEDYQRQSKRLSVRIMTSGLGHAIAYMNAKSGMVNDRLGAGMADWLLVKRPTTKRTRRDKVCGKILCDEICHRDANFLRFATNEALQYLQWLVRFAEAEIRDKNKSQ